MGIEHVGRKLSCLLQIIHRSLEFAQPQFAMAAFQVKISALWSKGQARSRCRNGLAILPARRLSL